MKKILFFLILISFYAYSNILLQQAQKISDSEIAELADKWETQFTWTFGNIGNFTCCYENGNASFVMQ